MILAVEFAKRPSFAGAGDADNQRKIQALGRIRHGAGRWEARACGTGLNSSRRICRIWVGSCRGRLGAGGACGSCLGQTGISVPLGVWWAEVRDSSRCLYVRQVEQLEIASRNGVFVELADVRQVVCAAEFR